MAKTYYYEKATVEIIYNGDDKNIRKATERFLLLLTKENCNGNTNKTGNIN